MHFCHIVIIFFKLFLVELILFDYPVSGRGAGRPAPSLGPATTNCRPSSCGTWSTAWSTRRRPSPCGARFPTRMSRPPTPGVRTNRGRSTYELVEGGAGRAKPLPISLHVLYIDSSFRPRSRHFETASQPGGMTRAASHATRERRRNLSGGNGGGGGGREEDGAVSVVAVPSTRPMT